MVNPRSGGDVLLKWLGLALVLLTLVAGSAIAYSRLDTTVAVQGRMIEQSMQSYRELRDAVTRIDKSLAVLADYVQTLREKSR